MLTFSAIATFIFAAAVVVAQLPPIPIGTAINIVDFQGNVFDLVDNNTQSFAPVQTLLRSPGNSAQVWVIEKDPNFNGLFFILNVNKITISTPAILAGLVDHLSSQLCANNGGVPPTGWRIMPHPTGVGYCIFEGTTNLAVTSWKALTSPVAFTRNTPLTLQIFDPKEPQQIFNFTSGEPISLTYKFVCPQSNQQLVFNAATQAVSCQ